MNNIIVNLRKNKQEEELLKRRHIGEVMNGLETPLTERYLCSLIENAASSIPDVQFEAIQSARKLLSSKQDPPIDELINRKIVPILVQCLDKHNNPSLQMEAAWALTNIASGTSLQTQAVVTAGAVPLLLNLLESSRLEVCEQAMWAIGNIVGDGPQLRDHLISLNLIPRLLLFINPTTHIKLMQLVAWVFSSLCQNRNPPLALHVIDELLPSLKYLIIMYNNKDTDILRHTVWAINFITNIGFDQIQRVIDIGIIPEITPLLSHKEIKVIIGTMRALGNITTGTDEQTQIVIDAGVLRHFPALLSHPKEQICKEAIWFLSNIAAGNEVQIQAVINAGLIPTLIMHLSKSKFVTQHEAAWAITNLMVNGNRQQVDYVMNAGVVGPLCALLTCQDNQVIYIILEALQTILKIAEPDVDALAKLIEECEGVEKIEQLKNHKTSQIYKFAFDIIDKYFSEESTSPSPTSSGV